MATKAVKKEPPAEPQTIGGNRAARLARRPLILDQAEANVRERLERDDLSPKDKKAYQAVLKQYAAEKELLALDQKREALKRALEEEG